MPADSWTRRGGPVPSVPALHDAFRRGFYGLGRALLHRTPHPSERRAYSAGAKRAKVEPDLFRRKETT